MDEGRFCVEDRRGWGCRGNIVFRFKVKSG